MNPLLIVMGIAGAAIVIFGSRRAEASEQTQQNGEGPIQWLRNAIEGNSGVVNMGDMPTNEWQNVQAFLRMIRAAEGTASEDGYRTIVGGGTFDDFSDHPRVLVPFRQTDGKVNYSSAAGAYQFLVGTWDQISEKLRLPDFSPASQDAAAIELIREAGALGDVRNGRFDDAVRRVSKIWASMPGAPYAQKTRTFEFVRAAYEAAGGAYA